VVVLELELVTCDGLAEGVEDEEAGGSRALVNAANKPSLIGIIAGLADVLGQLIARHVVKT
jgi:hypothetical protein